MTQPSSSVVLKFDPERNRLGDGKELREGLSVAARVGRNLFVASDETATVERLTTEDERVFTHHATFALADFIDLPGGDAEEVDLEGLSYHDGYLWLVGSHSVKRKKPKDDSGDDAKNIERLARVEREGNRYTLARIPLVETEGGDYELFKARQNYSGAAGPLTAAQLPGTARGNALTDALREDEHLAPF
ncbi:MAG: DUF3616 domain-containing protein, partial [Pyrinomonadaceae bacterium]